MNWKRLNRNSAGNLEWDVLEDLKDCESSSVVFWNNVEGIPEILLTDCVLIVDENPGYTHYLKLAPPKIDRRRKEYRKGGEDEK